MHSLRHLKENIGRLLKRSEHIASTQQAHHVERKKKNNFIHLRTKISLTQKLDFCAQLSSHKNTNTDENIISCD